MAELDETTGKLIVKIVYYGPALSGKTTNLMQLHDILDARRRGEFMTFETKGDRTLFFDFLPALVTSGAGIDIKFKMFTVPGQPEHDATRKAVLSRADGVVFVADSRISQATSNFESFDNLEKNAARVGLDIDRLPIIIQFNKRDLPDIVDETDVLKRWGPTGLPVTFSSALYGRGVGETFKTALDRTYHHLDRELRLNERFGMKAHNFIDWISGKEDGSGA